VSLPPYQICISVPCGPKVKRRSGGVFPARAKAGHTSSCSNTAKVGTSSEKVAGKLAGTAAPAPVSPGSALQRLAWAYLSPSSRALATSLAGNIRIDVQRLGSKVTLANAIVLQHSTARPGSIPGTGPPPEITWGDGAGVVPDKSRTRTHLGTSAGLLPGDRLARFVLGTEIPGTTRCNALPVD